MLRRSLPVKACAEQIQNGDVLACNLIGRNFQQFLKNGRTTFGKAQQAVADLGTKAWRAINGDHGFAGNQGHRASENGTAELTRLGKGYRAIQEVSNQAICDDAGISEQWLSCCGTDLAGGDMRFNSLSPAAVTRYFRERNGSSFERISPSATRIEK